MMYTAVLSERIACLRSFTVGCRESLGVGLTPSFADIYLWEGDRMGLLFPDVSG